MGNAAADQRFGSYEDVKKCLDEWFAAKSEDFYWRDIHKLPKRWEQAMQHTLNKALLSFFRI